MEDDSMTVFIKKFGQATLLEEREDRMVHEVKIKAKSESRITPSTPIIDQFIFKCSCESRKHWCIHLSLTMITQFS